MLRTSDAALAPKIAEEELSAADHQTDEVEDGRRPRQSSTTSVNCNETLFAGLKTFETETTRFYTQPTSAPQCRVKLISDFDRPAKTAVSDGE